MTTGVSNSDIEKLANEAPPSVLEEFQDLMDDLATKQRDPNIPAGTPLGGTNVEGMPVTFHKQASMHHINGQPLPERVPLYQYPTNEVFLIPTARVFNRLARVDNGHRTWSRQPFPDATPPEYIYREVPTITGVPMTKKFLNQAAYESFMRNKHPDTWESMLRDEARSEREADREEQRKLAQALLAAAGAKPEQNTPTIPTSLIEHLDVEGLKALADEFDIKMSDRRSAEKMRAELKAALEPANE